MELIDHPYYIVSQGYSVTVYDCQMKKGMNDREKLILRLLLEREMCGYEISKELASKGTKFPTNYIYMTLCEMERKGLLKSRWLQKNTEKKSRPNTKKHFYSLSRNGEDELKGLLKERAKK